MKYNQTRGTLSPLDKDSLLAHRMITIKRTKSFNLNPVAA
jgi:hypothetical protein